MLLGGSLLATERVGFEVLLLWISWYFCYGYYVKVQDMRGKLLSFPLNGGGEWGDSNCRGSRWAVAVQRRTSMLLLNCCAYSMRRAFALGGCFWGFMLFLLGVYPMEMQANTHTGWQDSTINRFDAQGRREGVWEKRRPNGTLLYRAEYKAGELVGKTVRYSEAGRMEATIEHADAHVAHVCLFDEQGRKQGEGSYYDRQKDGEWRYWSGSKLVRVEGWKRGVKHGVFETYSNSGQLAERQNWREGKLHGRQELYYASGALRMVSEMRDDVPVGVTHTYFSTGLVRMQGQYEDGLREGEWKVWSIDGRVESVVMYRAGKVVGEDLPARISAELDSLLQNAGRIAEPEVSSPYGY